MKMAIQMNVDPWEEIRCGRADESGASLYLLYSGVQNRDLRLIALTLKSVIKNEQWRKWRWIGDEFGCKSLRECLQNHPPKGIGLKNLEILRRLICDDYEALDMLDAALKNPVGRPPSKTVDNINNSRPTGTSIEYALRRLRADDRPIAKELHAKVCAGELSAHAAAVAAGYRKKPVRKCPSCGHEW
jgi:hypothetical protein